MYHLCGCFFPLQHVLRVALLMLDFPNATRKSSNEHPILSPKHSAGDIVHVNAPDFWANKWQQPQPFKCGGKKGAATTPDAVPQLPYLSMHA